MIPFLLLRFIILFFVHHGSTTILALSAKPTQFQQFKFAPNGVCLEPAFFVVPSTSHHHHQHRRLFTMRNVPGDGDCMFQATALAAATSFGLGANMTLLRKIALETRQVVASILESDGTLYIEKNRLVPARRLLHSAANDMGVTPEEYLALLRKEGRDGGLYGGGPELTVLSNVLRRPISIYELDDTAVPVGRESMDDDDSSSSCCIVCKGIFGAPLFDDPCRNISNSAVLSNIQPGAYSWHLHILVVDAGADKHACVLLPQSPI